MTREEFFEIAEGGFLLVTPEKFMKAAEICDHIKIHPGGYPVQYNGIKILAIEPQQNAQPAENKVV